MKQVFASIAALILMTAICRAQDNQPAPFDAGWFAATNASGSSEASTSFPYTANPTYPGGSSAIAEAGTADITNLAQNLNDNPTLIYDYVHDQIQYSHYFGSHKGAEMTLLERSGNDFDECSLLVALLRAAGYSPSYQFGIMEIPYIAPNQVDYQHWIGATMPNTNWSAIIQLYANLNGEGGFPLAGYFTGDTNDLFFHHVWVTLPLNGTTYVLDPAFKMYDAQSGINLDSAADISTNTLLTDVSAGATANANYVQGLNEGNLRRDLTACATNLVNYIQNNTPNDTVEQIASGRSMLTISGSPLPTAQTAWTNLTQGGNWPVSTWSYIPTSLMAVYGIVLPGTTTYSNWFYIPSFQGAKLSLICTSNGVAELYSNDTQIVSVQTTGGTNTSFYPTISIQHPFGNGNSWSFTLPGLSPRNANDDQSSSKQAYQRANATYVLLYGLDPNAAWMTERQQQLDSYLAQGYSSSSRQVMSETLNVMGLSWLAQTELVSDAIGNQTSTLLHFLHRLGRMAQETGNGYYIDVYEQVLSDHSLVTTNDTFSGNQGFQLNGYFGSALEHGIIEQMQSSNIVGASTVKLLELASTNNQKIYLATSANWTSGADVSANISNYNIPSFTSNIDLGYVFLLPQNGSIQIAGSGSWTGSGYVQLLPSLSGTSSMGMIIGANGYGGYSSTPNPPSPIVVTTINENNPTYFNPQSPTLQVPAQIGADPVNLVDGSFQITSTDLSMGQTDPRGLNLTRYYSSARRNSNLAGMAPGWLHSYCSTAVPNSAWQAGLGSTTPEQMAPVLVSVRTAVDLFSGQATPENWMTLALTAKWGIDQIINNAVSVNLGDNTVQFIKEPNGTYTPQGNCTMSLTQSGGAFTLQERHGRAFKFNTNTFLTNIVDQYGQSMRLSYNSNNLVTNVTDWTNRSLTFTYTSGALTSVSDSTGRSVSYGYTGGDLTSYTDPEHKTTTYFYDTNNDLIATFDALNNLVESNYYNGNGQITTQLTEGQTNKTWQVSASGYYTIEIDPAGDPTIYTYDNKSRLTAYQDGMGNVTQTVYDGQDHVIQTISPLNETNQFVYDGNNNMIESIDPLGYSNVFKYDGNNNLTSSTDGDHNTSYFGYNAEFSLTGSTNGNGDYFTLAYNPNGTLHSRTDSVGTTAYGYDSYGTLNSITYPSPLGSESFINNALGDPTSHTDARLSTTTFSYNNRRQLTNAVAPTNVTTKATFDANANLSTTTDARGNVTSNSWSTTRKLLTTTMPVTPQGTPVVTSTYDNRDWLASIQNPRYMTTYYVNDAAQRLVSTIDPMQRTNKFTFDDDSHERTATDAANDVTTQFWDARGDLVNIIDAATNVVGKTYDGAGNLAYLTNRNGKLWTFQYDGANRLNKTISPLSHSSSQIYNNRGLLQSSTDPLSRTTTFGYDARGRLTSKADGTGTTTYYPDLNGNLTNLTESSQSIQQTFDAYNRLSSYTDVNGFTVQYQRDPNGNVTHLTYPGNLTVTYYYDSNNRLTNVSDWLSHTTAITYDLAGHLTSIARPNNTVRAMSYDNDGELTNIIEQTTTKYPICFYTLNYNLAGRVQWEFKGPLPHSNSVPTRTMTFDNDNRLATFNGTNVSVDNAGNLTYGPGTNNTFETYAYDPRNRLTSAGGIAYGYDPANNRTFLTNGGTVSVFVTEAQSSEVLMRIAGNVTNYYIYGPGLLYEIDVTPLGTATAFYHFDSRGSTVVLTDADGNPTDGVEYSPYGTTTYRFGANNTPFLYNGQLGVQTDPNGLFYMRSRYYNPYISRFINADPSGFNGGLNFYLFCNDNPINAEDPFGLWAGADDLAFTVGGAVLGGTGSAISGLLTGTFSWSKVGYGAVAGAAGGEATLYGGPVVGGLVSGAANNFLSQSATMANTGDSFNPYTFGASTAIGGITGAIGDQIPMPSINGLNAGQGSYEAVSSAILTKLGNGTIQNISWSTAGTIFMSETYNDIPAAALDAIVDIGKEAGQGEGGTQSSPTGK